MGFKNRGYSRDTPKELVRDYKLFAIACEGSVREPQYFSLFKYLSQKIKIDVIEEYLNEEDTTVCTKSSPNWVLNKAVSYINDNNLIAEDELWFVMDIDRWTYNQINTLQGYCNQNKNWNLVISNPCFEVWLYFHKKSNIQLSSSITSKDFKTEISKFDKAGYDKLTYILDIMSAIDNAKNADSNLNHFFPNPKETKVYQLAEALVQACSKNDFQEFITNTIPKLIEEKKEKIRKKKRK